MSKQEKKDFIALVENAKDGYYEIPELTIGEKVKTIIESVFNDLNNTHKIENLELIIKEGFLKNDGGNVREASHNYETNVITIYLASIVYTFCKNIIDNRKICLPHEEKRELAAVSTNTIAHEFRHALQLKEERDMTSESVENDADKFSRKFVKNNLKKYEELL